MVRGTDTVEVAEWLNDYGCKCDVPAVKWGWFFGGYAGTTKLRWRPVQVNFLGLFDPVSMHWEWGYEKSSIPSNVNHSAAVYRTSAKQVFYFRPVWYEGLDVIGDLWVNPSVVLEHDKWPDKPNGMDWTEFFDWLDTRRSSHGQTGTDPASFQWMRDEAMKCNVDFDTSIYPK